MSEPIIKIKNNALGDYWPGIQLYYPPVKYAPSLGIYEDLEAAAQQIGRASCRERVLASV